MKTSVKSECALEGTRSLAANRVGSPVTNGQTVNRILDERSRSHASDWTI